MQHVNLLLSEWVGLSLTLFFELFVCKLLWYWSSLQITATLPGGLSKFTCCIFIYYIMCNSFSPIFVSFWSSLTTWTLFRKEIIHSVHSMQYVCSMYIHVHSMLYFCQSFDEKSHCIHIFWCISMLIGHNDPLVESHIFTLTELEVVGPLGVIWVEPPHVTPTCVGSKVI